MGSSALMSEKEKPPTGGGKKQNPGVKLNPLFHQKLKLIADDVGIDMGALIERELEEFVNREGARVAKKLFPGSSD